MKTTSKILSTLLMLTLVSVSSLRAQVVLQDVAEATVRAGSNAGLDVNEVTTGFQRVKYVQDAAPGNTTSCAKAYFKWDFTGQTPNTNADLTLSLTGAANSQSSAMRVWALDQAYPDFTNSVLVWNTAQANDTNFVPALGVNQGTFQQLTNGPFTAHPVANFTATGTASVTIPAPWGNLIISNQLVFVIAGTNNAALAGNNGYRMALNTTALVFNQIIGTNPPSISSLPDISVVANQNSVTNNFTLTDPDGNAANFNSGNVTATSSDLSGTIVAAVTILGTGANEQIFVTAGTTAGNATIKVTATDELGDTAQRTFKVTVLPQTFPPTISTPAATNTLLNTAVTVPFTIGDLSAPVSTLTVTASVNANSANELASAIVGGSGANRTVTVMPNTNADGVGLVDLSVTDTNGTTVTSTFAVMILTNAAVFDDHFDYTAGSIFSGSFGVWSLRGNTQPVGMAIANQAVSINSGAANDNAYGTLVGAPYATGKGSVIYVTFTGTWTVAPTANSGSFISLGNNPTISSPQVCSISSTPDLLGDGGDLNLRIANGNVYTTNFFPIVLNTPYRISARYDVDAATTTLWIGATNEADSSVTNVNATDVTAPVAVSLVNLTQNGNTGALSLDDLKVSVVFKPVVTALSLVGSNVQIDFAAGTADDITSFGILTASDLSVPLSPVSATFSSLGGGHFRATLPVTATRGFYRLYRQPFSF